MNKECICECSCRLNKEYSTLAPKQSQREISQGVIIEIKKCKHFASCKLVNKSCLDMSKMNLCLDKFYLDKSC